MTFHATMDGGPLESIYFDRVDGHSGFHWKLTPDSTKSSRDSDHLWITGKGGTQWGK
ncbi:hypothetical protein GCM10027562_28270 [Arthrobacter pigmenti]